MNRDATRTARVVAEIWKILVARFSCEEKNGEGRAGEKKGEQSRRKNEKKGEERSVHSGFHIAVALRTRAQFKGPPDFHE